MALVRAQVVLQGGSNKPEDRFVNTFHFAGDDIFATQAAVVGAALIQFYNAAPPGQTNSVGAMLSKYVSRPYTINCYDLAEALPRTPTTIYATLPTPYGGGDTEMPEECACCLSFRAAPPNTPSRKGRIYVGPFGIACTSVATATTPVRISNLLRDILCSAAVRLRDRADCDWVIYSTKNSAAASVVSGWVDNAVDIVRKRGPEATVRTLWG